MSDQISFSVYDLLSYNEETKSFAALLSLLPELVACLQDPAATVTVWAPDKHAMQIHEDKLRAMSKYDQTLLLRYLVSPHYITTDTLAGFPNVPVLLAPIGLNGSQLLRTRAAFSSTIGPTFNVTFDAQMKQSNLQASNGVVHIIDRVPDLPVTMLDTINALPTAAFSLLQVAVNSTPCKLKIDDASRKGGTFFAPTNAAFLDLGEELTGDLFDQSNTELLTTLLDHHFCPNKTLYSNMYYGKNDSVETEKQDYPFLKGNRVFVVPTAVPGQTLSVSVHRYGGLIDMTIDEDTRVISQDHIASDGVIHVVNHLLMPRTVVVSFTGECL